MYGLPVHTHVCVGVCAWNQESGRAGRDGKAAVCLLLFDPANLVKQTEHVYYDRDGLQRMRHMTAYCYDATRCRRRIIAASLDAAHASTDCGGGCVACIARHKRAVASVPVAPIIAKLHKVLQAKGPLVSFACCGVAHNTWVPFCYLWRD